MAELALTRELRRMLQRIAEDGPITEERVIKPVRRKSDTKRAELSQLLKADYVRRVGVDIEISRTGLAALDASPKVTRGR